MKITRDCLKYNVGSLTIVLLVAICCCMLICSFGIDDGTTSVLAFVIPSTTIVANTVARRKGAINLEYKYTFSSDARIKPFVETVLYGSRDSIYTKRVGSLGGGTPDEIRSKRQERVGQLVSSELGKIIHSGIIKGRDVEYMEHELRQRISVVKTDVSPDLRQARVSVSIRAAPNMKQSQSQIPNIKNYSNLDSNGTSGSKDGNTSARRVKTVKDNDEEEEDDGKYAQQQMEQFTSISSAAVDKRRIYSWLVRNTKPIRHTLAQRMSHMKTCPTLTFVQVDVAAAVDVMYLIDKVVAGQKRETIQTFPENGIDDLDDNDDFQYDDDEDDDDEDDGIAWEEIDDDFFRKR